MWPLKNYVPITSSQCCLELYLELISVVDKYAILQVMFVCLFDPQDVTLKYIEVNSSRSQHTNATNGIHAPAVAPQVHNMETESAVTSDVGSRATQSFVHELVASRTEDGGSLEKPAAQENSDSLSKPLQNSGLDSAASDSREPMRTAAAQEKNQLEEEEGSHVGRVVDRQTDLDPPVQVDNAGEPACHIGLVSVTETGDITGQIRESKEKDGHLRESSLERVSI
jgi:hypothetical protein